jgi:hypothetical protein
MTRKERLDAILNEGRMQDETWLGISQALVRLPDDPIAIPSSALEQFALPPAAPTGPLVFGIRG